MYTIIHTQSHINVSARIHAYKHTDGHTHTHTDADADTMQTMEDIVHAIFNKVQ